MSKSKHTFSFPIVSIALFSDTNRDWIIIDWMIGVVVAVRWSKHDKRPVVIPYHSHLVGIIDVQIGQKGAGGFILVVSPG